MQVTTIVILFAGLALLSVTMLLILRIMQSGAVSYESVQNADPSVGLATTVRKLFRRNKPDSHFLENPLHQWRRTVTAHKDLYLPCRVNSLRDLRHAMEDEEETLRQLADAANHPGGELTGDLLACWFPGRAGPPACSNCRMAAATITSVGEGYVLRGALHRSHVAAPQSPACWERPRSSWLLPGQSGDFPMTFLTSFRRHEKTG